MRADIDKILEARRVEREERRRREARNRLVIMCAGILAFVFALSFVFSSKSIAASDIEYHKHFKTIQITDNMTIEDIAEEYAIPEVTTKAHYAREVRFMNNLDSSENPNSGKYIIIPYYDAIHS